MSYIKNGVFYEDESFYKEETSSSTIVDLSIINSPSHYAGTKIEVIDYIEDKKLGYHLGNVVKYVSRAGRKGKNKALEDLYKAKWYLERMIKKVENDEIMLEGEGETSE